MDSARIAARLPPLRSGFAALLTIALLPALLVRPAAAQRPGALLQLLIIDAESHEPVSGAEVAVNGGVHGALSGTDGMIEIAGVDGDSLVVELRRVGYASRGLVVTPTAGMPLLVTVPLELAPTFLPAVRVEVEGARRSRALREFYERSRGGPGQYLTREDIIRRGVRNLADLFRTLPGISLSTTAFGERPEMEAKGSFLPEQTGEACSIQYFVDGTPVRPPAGAIGFDVDLNEVEGIEIYRRGTSVPARYQRQHGSCGVILIWKGDSLDR